jgi:hypothetical protein
LPGAGRRFAALERCSVFEEVGSWFASSGKKSNLRGVRIPVMSLDSRSQARCHAGRHADPAPRRLQQS